MPTPPEQPARPDEPPEYYGATLFYPNCPIFIELYQRISRGTPELLGEALEAELAKHARLHRAAKSTMCIPRGELNGIYRLPVSPTENRFQWLVSETFTTTWDDEAGIFHIMTERKTV